MAFFSLLDLIEQDSLNKLREQTLEADECGFEAYARQVKEKLCNGLSEEQKELVNRLEMAVINKMDSLHYVLQTRLVNHVFWLGMEMQRAFDEEDV